MKSSAYVLGALDALVKSGEVSPEYAAGVVDVLSKEADWTPWADSNAQNLLEEWQGFAKANPGAYNAQTGRMTLNGQQAKQILRNSRHWWTDAGGRMADAIGSFGSWLGNKFDPTAKSMSWEDMKRMHAVKQNNRDLAQLQRLRQSGAIVPSELYSALQDQHTRDAETAWHTAGRFMSNAERSARYGDTIDAAKERYRTLQGTAAMRGGLYNPTYDKASAKPKTPSMHNDSMAHMYGSKDRAKLYSSSFRNGLGM